MVDQGVPRRSGRTGLNPGLLDDIDREIVRILQIDGRTSNSEIARRLGVTETTIRKRLAALLAGNYIEIVAVPTPRLAGLTLSAIMGVVTTLKELRQVADAVASCPEVRYCGVATGRYNLIVEAFFTDSEHLKTFVIDVLGSMDGVEKVETSMILTIEKFSADWNLAGDE